MTGKRPTEAQRLFAKYIVVDEMGKSEAFLKGFSGTRVAPYDSPKDSGSGQQEISF